MNKVQIHQLFVSELEKAYENAMSAAQQAHATATHSESVAENKYDTFGLESAYLAHGQSQRVIQYRSELQSLKNMKLPDLSEDDPIALGCLVTINDQHGNEKMVFLSPVGGHSIIVDRKTVALVSASSPLGKHLINSHKGDVVSVPIGMTTKDYAIVEVI